MIGQKLLHRLAPTMFTSTRGLPDELPGPAPSRFLSTGGAMLPWGADSLGHAGRLFKQYGRVVALVRGGGMRHISASRDCPGTVLAYGAEAVEQSTMAHELFGKTSLVGALHPGASPSERERPLLNFGAGLFAVNGDQHRRHRRLLTPAFSRKRLGDYAEKMVALTAQMLDTWTPGEERAIHLDLRRLASAIVTETLLGGGDVLEVQQATTSLAQAIQLMGQPLTRILPFDLPGLPFRSYLNATGELERGMFAILDARRKESPNPASSEKGDMLSALVTAHDSETNSRLSDSEIVGHLSVFFAAGHETSANALSWTLFLLAQFPEVAAQAREEVEAVLRGGEPTSETVEQLVYLGNVVKESLRLFTPAPWNGRVLTERTTFGGFEIPQGAEIMVSLYETHRVPEVFERPLAFRPERWETLRPSPYEYNPFSAGPRTCIGAAFATLEIKLVLAMLLQRYRLELVPQRIDRFAELVLAPKALKMRVVSKGAPVSKERPKILGNVYDMVELPIA
jgi:cytochrome P450